MVCSKFMMIASFNLVPTDRIIDKMFTFAKTQPPTWNYSQLGYNSLSLINNLGLIFFSTIGQLFASFIYIAFFRGKEPSQLSKILREHAFRGAFIRFFMESYLQIAVSVALNLTHFKSHNWSEHF